MGKEREYELLVSGSQSLLPPPGASEVDVKAWQVTSTTNTHTIVTSCLNNYTSLSCKTSPSQLHRLLESTECDMIKAVQRRINRELSLVLSERTRQDTGLPTGKIKNLPLKHSSHTEEEM